MYRVYFLDVKNLKEIFSYEEIYSKVSLYRKNKVDRLMFDKDKWLALCAEYLFMQALKEFEIDYSKIEIGFIKNNKPVIKNCEKELYFNLSHSGEMAMCVISDCEIGCDIQKVLYKEDLIDIAKRFFNPFEFQLINNAKDDEKINLFYRIWVLKESYIKATGKGFQMPFNDFIIEFKNNIPRVYINNKIDERYIFEEKDVGTKMYKSAICKKIKCNK